MNKQDIIKYLSNCELVEFGNIVSKTIENRNDTVQTEGKHYETRVLLAQVYKELEDDDTWSEWQSALIGQADLTEYDPGWEVKNGEPFLQMGKCISCGVEVHSHAKKAICPICKTKVLTT